MKGQKGAGRRWLERSYAIRIGRLIFFLLLHTLHLAILFHFSARNHVGLDMFCRFAVWKGVL